MSESMRRWRAPVLLAVAVIVADQLAKHWAVTWLGDDRVIEVVWTLQFNLAFNSGMAFGRASGMGPFIAVVATLVIVWLLVSLRAPTTRLAVFGMGLVIGGAAGNLIDRIFRNDAWLRGSVVDYIDFQWFPIFNIADMAINVGAGALILNAVLMSRRGDLDDDAIDNDAIDNDAIDDDAIDDERHDETLERQDDARGDASHDASNDANGGATT